MTSNLFVGKLFSWGRNSVAFAATLVLAASVFVAPVEAKDAAKAKTAATKTFNPWTKLCQKAPKGKVKICVTRIDGLGGANLIPYAPIALEQIEGKDSSIVITLPHVWLVPVEFKSKDSKKTIKSIRFVGARWAILTGVFIKIDENKIHKLNYVYCDQASCVAQTKATKQLMTEMKKGKKITIVALNNKKPMKRPFPLKGFAAAVDGKAGDAKMWQKRLSVVRKRQISLVQQYQKAEIAATKKMKKEKKK